MEGKTDSGQRITLMAWHVAVKPSLKHMQVTVGKRQRDCWRRGDLGRQSLYYINLYSFSTVNTITVFLP